MSTTTTTTPKDEEQKEVRIFMDGSFDMMHYGHVNAFRLARTLGTHLIVGINSDVSITECKGPPLMNDLERMSMVESCKFVDQVVEECPYIMNQEYLDYVFDELKVDYVIHGDDPCIVNGKDVYAAAKATGKYQSIPRTEGISTTDIVGRMLMMNTSSATKNDESLPHTLGEMSRFLTTSHLLSKFSVNHEAPLPGQTVVYMDGDFDMYHCGHVAMLKAAKQRGDYLVVGIHGDATVNRNKGHNLPLMNLHERALSVLGCRYVDNVLLDAPYTISPALVDTLKVSVVVVGGSVDDDVRFSYPQQAGILEALENPSNFNMGKIVQQIRDNETAFQAKFKRKMQAEHDFLKNKYGEKDEKEASSSL